VIDLERRRGLVVLAAAVPLLALVLLVDGLLPGMVTDGPWAHLTLGAIQCVHDLGLRALTSRCGDVGQPLGFPFLSNGPVVYLAALLSHLPGIGRYAAYLLSGAAFQALALGGCYGFVRALGTGRAIALGAAVAYLLSPSVVGLQGFGGTFTGVSLLGAFAFADVLMTRAGANDAPRTVALAAVGYVAVRTGALFLDGYAFIVSGLVSAALWGGWLVASPPPSRLKRAARALALLAVANAVAVVSYRLYLPNGLGGEKLEYFRAMGADLITLVVPGQEIWSAHALGVASNHAGLWGDGTNAAYNFVGAAGLALAIAGVAARRCDPRVIALGAAGVLALILALGPSVKVGDKVPGQRDERPYAIARPGAEVYTMPGAAARVNLPWGAAYPRLPGLKQMRAAYRWLGVTRLALIVLGALAVDTLARGPTRRRVIGAVLVMVALLELAPNVPSLVRGHRDERGAIVAVDDATVGFLRSAAAGARRAFFLNYDGAHNDYVVNDIASAAGLRTYNVGGDKNVSMSSRRWPAPVAVLAHPRVRPDAVASALASGVVDVVVLPYFHLRWSAYEWPPPASDTARARAAFHEIIADRRFEVHESKWLATVRLASPGQAQK
jgi:hypothetical protein